jgi:hypothetical protein
MGYCAYTLTAKIKEIYKGNVKTEFLEFHTVAEAEAVHDNNSFLGEWVVFLHYSDPSNRKPLQTIENSTRPIKYGILENMRKIAKKRR